MTEPDLSVASLKTGKRNFETSGEQDPPCSAVARRYFVCSVPRLVLASSSIAPVIASATGTAACVHRPWPQRATSSTRAQTSRAAPSAPLRRAAWLCATYYPQAPVSRAADWAPIIRLLAASNPLNPFLSGRGELIL